MINKNRLKPVLNLIYSVLGLVVFNAIIQFVLYPFFNNKLGEDKFGVILTLISLVTIASSSIGCAANSARMSYEKEKESENGDYNITILLFNILGIAFIIISLLVLKTFDVITAIFLVILMVLTSFRYYANVEYRKNLKFSSFFIFHLLISVGYCVGCLLYLIIPIWELAMILGECAALAFVFIRGTVFKSFFRTSIHKKKIFILTCSLFIGELINAVILNADRLLLYKMMDSNAVTTFYVASLVGKIVAMITIPLSGVIIGYLSRYTGNISKKFVLIYMGGVFILGVIALICCLIASPLIIKILYPNMYESCKNIIFFAALSQVIFFCSNVAITLVVKFMNSKFQLIINIVHLIVYVIAAIVGIKINGLIGFSIGISIANLIKFILIVFISLFCKKTNYNEIKKIDKCENVL